ncbi:hypothetical protein [Colwellia sp. Bg11-28]|uniref:hypothetical protein n=1 Tax=Colwellia sp. Bg11-28 TaxID=2058305 RepID=UPI000C32D8F5|nr:hypothetical protein [Colwellia sp. Bg11-28]PKH85868.1 hypothetical protein CXF79_21795 [Colwellia sp. Bg11-28]
MNGKKIKESLLAFLDTGSVIVATSPAANIRNITHAGVSEDNIFEHLSLFLKRTKINIEIPTYLANTESLQVTKKTIRIIDALESLKLITKGQEMTSGLYDNIQPTPCIIYSITPSGLEAALKLQEHDDAEKRYKEQGTRNTISICISIFALLAVFLNSYFSYERLNRLEEVIKPQKILYEVQSKDSRFAKAIKI